MHYFKVFLFWSLLGHLLNTYSFCQILAKNGCAPFGFWPNLNAPQPLRVLAKSGCLSSKSPTLPSPPQEMNDLWEVLSIINKWLLNVCQISWLIIKVNMKLNKVLNNDAMFIVVRMTIWIVTETPKWRVK